MNKSLDYLYKNNIDKLIQKNIPEIELRILLCSINKISCMSDYYLRREEPVLDEKEFNSKLKKLLDGEPIQYIINSASFCGLDLYVDNSVLIPRMETEEVVQYALKLIKKKYKKPIKILDVGTGSGCIAIALEKEHVGEIFASDISEKSLRTAVKNAEIHNSNIQFFKSDLLQYPISEKMKFDFIISNPPYIINKNEIDERTIKFEPRQALYPNEDVYSFYERILKESKQVLSGDYSIVLEIGYDMKDRLEVIVNSLFPNKKVEFIKDINGKYRIISIS